MHTKYGNSVARARLLDSVNKAPHFCNKLHRALIEGEILQDPDRHSPFVVHQNQIPDEPRHYMWGICLAKVPPHNSRTYCIYSDFSAGILDNRENKKNGYQNWLTLPLNPTCNIPPTLPFFFAHKNQTLRQGDETQKENHFQSHAQHTPTSRRQRVRKMY